jgi:hypothetical protein
LLRPARFSRTRFYEYFVSETKRTENSVNYLLVKQPVENNRVVLAHATTRELETKCKYETRKSQTLEGQWNIIGKRGEITKPHDIGIKSAFSSHNLN